VPSSAKEIERLIRIAVELRVAGGNWNAVASKTGRSAATCRRWPVRFRKLWHRIYAEALSNRTEEARSEAVATLRGQLRNEDEKLRGAAARALLSHTDRAAKSPQAAAGNPLELAAESIADSEAQDLEDEYGSTVDA